MAMEKLPFAIELRNIIEAIARDTVDRMRPKYRYARVVSINSLAYKCDVTYNGENSVITVNMGTIQPSAVNQIVRIEGMGIDKFITDVIGGPAVFRGTTQA